MRGGRATAVLFLATVLMAAGAPAADGPAKSPTKAALKPGDYTWHPERSPQGPVVIIVNLPDQMAYVYRNGIRIGATTVSTGREGHTTPTGVFTILQKETMHHSNLYNSAPMPFMERLNWGGVCLHAGGLPGYPSSHGCVHLPLEFAKLLYTITDRGTTVVIADASSAPADVLHPSILVPADVPGSDEPPLEPSPGTSYSWQPERSPEGPLTVLVSAADARVYVYRNGVQIGEAPIRIVDPNPPLVHAVYTMLAGTASQPSRLVPNRPAHRWMRVDLANAGEEVPAPDPSEQVHFHKAFAALLYDALEPGTTLLVTNHAATPETKSGSDFVVMQAQQPAPQ